MALIGLYIEREAPPLNQQGVRMRFIGRRADPVPADVLRRIEWAEELTAANERITLTVPFNYGGRAEIVDAARTFGGRTEEEFRAHLYAPDMQDPEILIRTSGERRLSNYLLWQVANTRLVFRDELWPDFGRDALEEVLEEFQDRPRIPDPLETDLA
jgi:undecaprenyl diphosphate synthase